jgi:hypothetical protein
MKVWQLRRGGCWKVFAVTASELSQNANSHFAVSHECLDTSIIMLSGLASSASRRELGLREAEVFGREAEVLRGESG